MALPLQRKLIFYRLGSPGGHLFGYFCRRGFQGVFFIVFIRFLCLWESFRGPLGSFSQLCFGEFEDFAWIGGQVASGLAEETLLGAFGHHSGAFRVLFRRISDAVLILRV